MSDIKRYIYTPQYDAMVEHPEGGWVRFCDARAVMQAKQKAEAECNRLQRAHELSLKMYEDNRKHGLRQSEIINKHMTMIRGLREALEKIRDVVYATTERYDIYKIAHDALKGVSHE